MVKSFVDLLREDEITLFVTLTKNSVGLARASIKGGADAIVVQYEPTYKNPYRAFNPNKNDGIIFKQIMQVSDVPVGIYLENKHLNNPQIMSKVQKLDFDFYMSRIPKSALKQKSDFPLPVSLVFGKDAINKVSSVKAGSIDLAEAIVVYEDNTVFSDEQRQKLYQSFWQKYSRPLVLAFSEPLEARDLKSLEELGCAGVMFYDLKNFDDPSSSQRTISKASRYKKIS